VLYNFIQHYTNLYSLYKLVFLCYYIVFEFDGNCEELSYSISDSEIKKKGLEKVIKSYVDSYIQALYREVDADYEIIEYKKICIESLLKDLKNLESVYGCDGVKSDFDKFFNDDIGQHIDYIIEMYDDTIQKTNKEYVSNLNYSCYIISILDSNNELYTVPIEIKE